MSTTQQPTTSRIVIATSPRSAAALGSCGWVLVARDARGWIMESQ